MVQIFQRESIFCNKISSGGSLFIKKLVPGGTNFGGSIFTMTCPTPTWFSNINTKIRNFSPRMIADFLIAMVRYLVLLVHQLANKFDLCNGCKALTSCQKQLYPVAICDDISVTLGGRLLPTCIQVQVNRASISPLKRPTSDSGKNSS